MYKFIYIGLSNLLALVLAAMIFPSIQWVSYETLVEAAILLTAINWLLRPLIMLLALPLNLITVGLFVLIINAWMIMLTDWVIKGWQIPGFWLALVTGIIVLACNSIAKKLIIHSPAMKAL
jgi:putative membrane protein